MSATGRGTKRRRFDAYDTAGWCVRAILHELPCHDVVLDPCAGKGNILHELRGVFPWQASDLLGIEIQKRRAEACRARGFDCVHGNALRVPWPKAGLIITNPPFGLVEQVARRALIEVDEGGTVAFLARIGFGATKKRRAFWAEHKADLFLFANRPSFICPAKRGKKATDACDYAWFLFGPGRGGRWERLEAEKE
jgi:hypothetical protein